MRLITSGILAVCASIWTISTSDAVEEAKCSKLDDFPRTLVGTGGLADIDCHAEHDGSQTCSYDATGCSWTVGPDERWPDTFATEHLPEGWISCKKPKVEQILHFRDGSRRFLSDECIVAVREREPPPEQQPRTREVTIEYFDKALKELRTNLNEDIRSQVDKRLIELQLMPPATIVKPPARVGPTAPVIHIHHHYHYYPQYWCPPPWWDPWW